MPERRPGGCSTAGGKYVTAIAEPAAQQVAADGHGESSRSGPMLSSNAVSNSTPSIRTSSEENEDSDCTRYRLSFSHSSSPRLENAKGLTTALKTSRAIYSVDLWTTTHPRILQRVVLRIADGVGAVRIKVRSVVCLRS